MLMMQYGFTALMKAAACNHGGHVEALLETGTDLEIQDIVIDCCAFKTESFVVIYFITTVGWWHCTYEGCEQR